MVPGAFPMLGVRLDSPLHPPRLAGMSIELMRERLAAARASFIEPCLPSPAEKPPAGANWTSRDQARRLPADGATGSRRHPAAHQTGNNWSTPLPPPWSRP